nr:phage tape measure protein [uncultured Mediterranean phage uvMED]
MASEYSVNIRLNTKQVKADLASIKKDIDKLGKVNIGANRRTQRTEATITKSKEAQKAAMVETRRIGDLVQKASDQGLKIDKARRAINRAALADGRGEFKVAKAQQKVALEELKIQRAITKEKAQQVRLSVKSLPRSGPVSSLTSLGGGTPLGLRAGPTGPVQAFPQTRDLGMFGPKLPFIGQTSGFGRSSLRGNRFQFGSQAQIEFSGKGMGRSPIGGRADLVGSPANLLSIGKQNAMPVKGFESLVGSPAYYEAQNKEMLRVAKMNTLPVKGLKGIVGSPAYFKDQAKQLKKLQGGPVNLSGLSGSTFGPQQPMQGPAFPTGAAQPLNIDSRGNLLPGPLGSRQTRAGLSRALARNRGPALQSAAISGAFPLLFGQGPLAAAGGAIGGGLGGAFGGQMGGFAGGLIGTSIVSGITGFANSITELGKSIETLDGQFNLLTQKSLFSTKEAENRAKVLQALGEREKLATLLSKELTNVLGQDGAEKLRRAAEASKELSKTFAELTINLQLALAGPLSQFLKLVNQVLDQGTAISLGQGKGTVNLGPGEQQFLKDFGGVLSSMSQSQIDNILRAQIGSNVEGLQITNERRQAIRKFDLARQTNPAGLDAFMGGGSSFAGGKTPLEVDAARVASAQKKVKTMQKEVEFAKLVVDEGLKEADIQKQIQAITENLNEEELKLLDTQGLSVRALVEKNNQAKQLVENARMIEESFKSLTQNVSTDLAQGIQGLIRGTSTLNDVLNNVLNKMIDAAFNMAFFGNAGGTLTKGLGLFGSLFSGFLANGGPAQAGKSYIVGEKGPELFTPSVSGMVSPNSSLGGSTNVVVNVDASGSSVEGDEEEGRQLGLVLSAAIESELIKQKRPGGLLA